MEGHLGDRWKHEGWHHCFSPNRTAHSAVSGCSIVGWF